MRMIQPVVLIACLSLACNSAALPIQGICKPAVTPNAIGEIAQSGRIGTERPRSRPR